MQSQIILNGFSREELLADITALVRSEIQAIPKPEKTKTYLSLDDVCELLDASKPTVYMMTHKKQIPHIKRGGKLLFNRLEIIGWLESSKQNVGQ